MIKLLFITLLGILYVGFLQPQPGEPLPPQKGSYAAQANIAAAQAITDAFSLQKSNVPVTGLGTVSKILKDDTNGHQHQRFILRLANGHSLLVAHNIELAPRVDDLQIGDKIQFSGEYEWNANGGVLHWTHHDPHNKHPNGWLKHHGNTYQ